MAWFVPAMMALSTAVTVMGQRQQSKQIKANAAWKNYENELSFQYEKQKKLKEQTKLMSEQRAKISSGGVQFTGSPLLIANSDFEEYEDDMYFFDKKFFVQTASLSSETAGLLTAQKYKMGATLLSGASSVGSYNQSAAAAKKGVN